MVDFVSDSSSNNQCFNSCSKSIIQCWILFTTSSFFIHTIGNLGHFVLEESYLFCNHKKTIFGFSSTHTLVASDLAWHHIGGFWCCHKKERAPLGFLRCDLRNTFEGNSRCKECNCNYVYTRVNPSCVSNTPVQVKQNSHQQAQCASGFWPSSQDRIGKWWPSIIDE